MWHLSSQCFILHYCRPMLIQVSLWARLVSTRKMLRSSQILNTCDVHQRMASFLICLLFLEPTSYFSARLTIQLVLSHRENNWLSWYSLLRRMGQLSSMILHMQGTCPITKHFWQKFILLLGCNYSFFHWTLI